MLHENEFESLNSTEKDSIIKSRIGQGDFRKKLLGFWKTCSVTNTQTQSVLRASHIKPWRVCTNQERLDLYNGLLLIPNLDILFDSGLICFDKNGRMNISERLSKSERQKLGINQMPKQLRTISPQHIKYLDYHQNHIFEK